MSNQTIDYGQIAAQATVSLKRENAIKQLESCDYVNLTDALSNKDRYSTLVLELLLRETQTGLLNQYGYNDLTMQRTYQLKCLIDKFGEPVKPGDMVEVIEKKTNRDVHGKKIGAKKMKKMKRRGEAKKLIFKRGYEVDAAGCITVPYKDALYLLSQFGVHYETKEPLSPYHERTREPVKIRGKGEVFLHHWRFEEVSPDEHKQLLKDAKKAGKAEKGKQDDWT
jgi:hypothetical protein